MSGGMSFRGVDQFGKMKLEWQQFRDMIFEKFRVLNPDSKSEETRNELDDSSTLRDITSPFEGKRHF